LSAITLRPVCDDDQELLYLVYASTRDAEMAMVPWSDDEKESFLRMQLKAQTTYWNEHYPDTERSIIESDGQPIGRLYLDRREDEIRIVDIALLSESRGAGIGRKLLEDVLAEAAAAGKAARIHVEKNNPALRLYHRLGFKITGDTGVYYLMEWLPESLAGDNETTATEEVSLNA
jgi:ribosomal protein S18 acetylase RimI-like enzyme